MLRRLRADAVRGLAFRKRGRCATTALRLTLGIDRDLDPAIAVRLAQARTFWQGFRRRPGLDTALAPTWPFFRRKHSGVHRWRRVAGPLGAWVATLADIGATAPEPSLIEWRGSKRNVKNGSCRETIAFVRQIVEFSIWRGSARVASDGSSRAHTPGRPIGRHGGSRGRSRGLASCASIRGTPRARPVLPALQPRRRTRS